MFKFCTETEQEDVQDCVPFWFMVYTTANYFFMVNCIQLPTVLVVHVLTLPACSRVHCCFKFTAQTVDTLHGCNNSE